MKYVEDIVNPKQEKDRHEERRNKMRLTVRAKLVVGFGGVDPHGIRIL